MIPDQRTAELKASVSVKPISVVIHMITRQLVGPLIITGEESCKTLHQDDDMKREHEPGMEAKPYLLLFVFRT